MSSLLQWLSQNLTLKEIKTYQLYLGKMRLQKKNFFTKLFQFRKILFRPVITNNLLNIPVISENGNLLIDETRKYATNSEIICEELNLKIKSLKTKVVTIPNFTPPANIYLQNNAIVSEQLQFFSETDFLRHKTLIFHSQERFLWQKDFGRRVHIIGWSENYIAIAASLPGTVTVCRLIDGKPVS